MNQITYDSLITHFDQKDFVETIPPRTPRIF